MRINYVFVGLWIGFFWSFFYAPCNVLYECKGSGGQSTKLLRQGACHPIYVRRFRSS